MATAPNLHEHTHADVLLPREDGSEFRMPGSFKRLLVEAFSDIAEADKTGRLEHPVLFFNARELGHALMADDEIWDVMNAVSKDPADHELMVNYAYALLPDWVKSKELLEKKFRIRLTDIEMVVSHGFYRGDKAFLAHMAAQQYSATNQQEDVTTFSAAMR